MSDTSVPWGEIPVAIYNGDLVSISLKVVGGEVPLTLGERIEVEVVEIVRMSVERAPQA